MKIIMDSPAISIEDIMTKKVVSVSPEMPLFEAAKIIAKHGFDGVPVMDRQGKLIGVLTEYDLVSKGSAVHLPTFQFLLRNLKIFQKDRSRFEKEVEPVASLKVQDVMNSDPLTLPEQATFEEVVNAFRDHHRVNPIPVIDREKHVVGVVSRYDVLRPLHLLE